MNRWKRVMAILLAASAALSGCGSGAGQESGRTGAKDTQMGRYMEQEIMLPEEIARQSYPALTLQTMEDGSLKLAEEQAGIFLSKDQGETWERQDEAWLSDLAETAYISTLALAPDGGAALAYTPYEEDGQDADAESVETQKTGPEEAAGADEGSAESAADPDGAFYSEASFQPQYLYRSPDGTTIPITYENGETYFYQLWFGQDNRLYGCSIGGGVFYIDPQTDTVKQLFEIGGLVDCMVFTEKRMIAFSTQETAVYDLENGMLAEPDTALEQFMGSTLEEAAGLSDGHAVVAAAGEGGDVFYFVTEKGLYRHAVGGQTVEQIIDGSINSMGDPMTSFGGMAVLPDGQFAVLYEGGRLCRYIYDETVSSVPGEQITVYSLEDSYTIRQAVSLYQKSHPDVYVKYETGMSGTDGQTAEDAVKNLNVRLAAGEGPDILVLDGLPMESYIGKGILADVSGIVRQMDGEDALLENIVGGSGEEDGTIRYLPVCFRIVMTAGDRQTAEQTRSLSDLADAVERLRQEQPEGSILGLRSADEVIRMLGDVCRNAWTAQDGQIDQEALAEFLRLAARVWQAEREGYTQEELEQYEGNQEAWTTDLAGEGDYYKNLSSGAVNMAMGLQKLGVGLVKGMDFDFNILATLSEKEDDFAYGPFEGQAGSVYLPKTMAGLAAASADNKTAADFYRFLYSREFQSAGLAEGFPVNEAAFGELENNPRGEDSSGTIAMAAEGSEDLFLMDVKWAPGEDFQRLAEIVREAATPSLADTNVEEAVYEIGPAALEGTVSAEEAAEQIAKKASLPLAE
ncbi:MAG: hypothetical protein Q4C82_04795 [Eubacteriales bacterium]|nr:hypothetical protein [Eubacteriales bacterium]